MPARDVPSTRNAEGKRINRSGRPNSYAKSAVKRQNPGQFAKGGSGAHGVVTAVDVDELAGREREPVGEEGDARAGDGAGVVDVPAERGAVGPHVLELGEPGDRPGRHRADR